MAASVGTIISSISRRRASCFTSLHNWQSATASPNDQPVAFPGNLFLDGQRSVTKVVTEFLGWLLIAFATLSSIDDDVVLVRHTVDANRAERHSIENHRCTRTLGSFVITMMLAHSKNLDLWLSESSARMATAQ